MSIAFVLGNGISRQGISLDQLGQRGPVYGCNALYREYTPSILVATDRPIAEQIQHSGYAQKHKFYTRKPIDGLGAMRIPQAYWGFSSGPAAVALAAMHGNVHVYMLGFDMGPNNAGKFNNVYSDTEFYKSSAATPTYTGNWTRQLCQVVNDFSKVNFYRIKGHTTAEIAQFQHLTNLKHLHIEDFLALINM